MTDMAAVSPPMVTRREDGRLLHFLKECPAWVVIGLFVGTFLAVWNYSHDDFIPRIIDGLVGALLTSIIAQRPRGGATNINADTVQTDSVQTQSMDQATVNADTINLKPQGENKP